MEGGSGREMRISVQTRYVPVTVAVLGDREATAQLPVADFHAST